MYYLTVENTTIPYGVEKSGGVIYLKVLLEEGNKNHDFIRERLEYLEEGERRRMGEDLVMMSNVRRLVDGNYLLRIRIAYFKNRNNIKMRYERTCDKDNYLKNVEDLSYDCKVNVKFKIGKGYKFTANDKESFGLNIYVDEVTVK